MKIVRAPETKVGLIFMLLIAVSAIAIISQDETAITTPPATFDLGYTNEPLVPTIPKFKGFWQPLNQFLSAPVVSTLLIPAAAIFASYHIFFRGTFETQKSIDHYLLTSHGERQRQRLGLLYALILELEFNLETLGNLIEGTGIWLPLQNRSLSEAIPGATVITSPETSQSLINLNGFISRYNIAVSTLQIMVDPSQENGEMKGVNGKRYFNVLYVTSLEIELEKLSTQLKPLIEGVHQQLTEYLEEKQQELLKVESYLELRAITASRNQIST